MNLLLGFWIALAAAQPLDLDALLDHHAAAHGLQREQSDPRALHLIADLEAMGLHGELESWSEPPLRSRSKLSLGPLTLETGFDGTTAWLRDRNGAVREAEAQERNGLLLEALVNTGGYALASPPVAMRRIAVEVDSSLVRLTVHPLFGDELHLMLDAYSHRIVSSNWHNGQGEESTEYLDYQWIDGLLLPGRTELEQGNLKIHSTLRSAERVAPRGAAFYAMPDGDLPSDIELAENGSSGRLPMLGEGGHILLSGWIGDRKAVFLLDSGAGSNVLNASVARELGLISEGEFEAIGVAGMENASFAKVDEVRLGGLRLLGQSWITLEFGSMETMFGIHLAGVLGYDTFSRLVTHVDYASRSVEFLDPTSFVAPDDAEELRLRLDLNVPTVKTSIEGIEAWLHVDTGSDNSIDLASPFVEAHELLDGREDLNRSSLYGVGGVGSSLEGTLDHVALGSFEYEHVTAFFHEAGDGIFENRSAAGIVGAAILADFELWFDYGNKSLWLRPIE